MGPGAVHDKLWSARPVRCPGGRIKKTGPQEITQLLLAWGGGDERALEELMPMVYDELRRVAARHLRRQSPGHIDEKVN
jgi:hypothetical protein